MRHELIELSTPGEVLKEEFLDPMGITQYALAKGIYVDPPRIAAIIKRKRKITADTALCFNKNTTILLAHNRHINAECYAT